MKYLLLSATVFLFCCKLNAQYTVEYIDSAIYKGFKKKLYGHITAGKPAYLKGWAYNKSSKKMFSIVVRDNNATKERNADTLTSTGYFFIENKLVKIHIKTFSRRKIEDEHLYFSNDQFLTEKSGLTYSAQQLSEMIKKAYELLADGKLRIEKKFTNR